MVKALVKTREGHGNLELLDKEVATPLDDKVKIKVHYAGICGTDIHTYEGHYKVNFPVTLGHEFSGEIVEVGADVKDFKVGDRVTSGFYKSNIQPGMTVAVMGCGSIGLLAIQWARIFGAAHIIAIDIDAHKLDIATSLGAHQTINSKEENLEKFIENHYANQIDLAIESSGAKVTIGQILTLPKKGGEVVLLGIPYDDIEIDRVHFEKILRNELTVCGSWNCLSSNFPGKEWTATLHYMKTKDINVKPIISHFLPLEKGPETFDKLVNKKERFDKVMFTIY
ncbi:TPA: zinc-binding dehydrogenase [Staphylococcus aureus]|nr:zinc-binding dehydrogenase [Staphylococcus aureus]